jgi:hypothetical protein
MQAIETRWLGPTDTKDSRIVARCEAGRIVVPWDDSADVFHNHAEAARKLAAKLGWTRKYYGSLYGASLPGERGYAFVMVHDDPARNVNTYSGFAPDVRCPHYQGPITNDPPTTNDCAQCHEDRKDRA